MSVQKLRGTKGFTLLELIVVIVILGILAALAIPSFTDVKAKAANKTALYSAEGVLRDARALAAFDGASLSDFYVDQAGAETSGYDAEADTIVVSSGGFTATATINPTDGNITVLTTLTGGSGSTPVEVGSGVIEAFGAYNMAAGYMDFNGNWIVDTSKLSFQASSLTGGPLQVGDRVSFSGIEAGNGATGVEIYNATFTISSIVTTNQGPSITTYIMQGSAATKSNSDAYKASTGAWLGTNLSGFGLNTANATFTVVR